VTNRGDEMKDLIGLIIFAAVVWGLVYMFAEAI